MKYYFAPLEGITNVFFRNTYDKYYSNIDKYYIPFLAPKDKTLHTKELRELDINRNNLKGKVIPQIISKNANDTIWLIDYLVSIGYDEINLNFGCPSPTVTVKGKGAGILKDLEYLDNYLKEIFKNKKCDISVKMRIGYEFKDEFYDILKVLNKYDIKELIIHPRTSLEGYTSHLHLDILDNLDKLTNISIIYNGEINSLDDINYIKNRFPYIDGVMMGRGLLKNPSMLLELNDIEKREIIKKFYNELEETNIKEFGFNNSKFYLKEIWAQLIEYFNIAKTLKKNLFKENDEMIFRSIAKQIIDTSDFSNNSYSIKNYISGDIL